MAFREWWTAVPEAVRTLSALLFGFAAAIALVGGLLNIPARVALSEAELARQGQALNTLIMEGAERDRRITAIDHRIDYVICLLEHQSGEGRRTPTQCMADYARPIRER
jgi:hypothetical protein